MMRIPKHVLAIGIFLLCLVIMGYAWTFLVRTQASKSKLGLMSRNISTNTQKNLQLGENLAKNKTLKSCSKLRFAPKSKPFPLTALATYPGSGNTWARHLIQQLTGYYTGSVYNDINLKKNGFPGEYKMNGRVIAIKTHRPWGKEGKKLKFKRAIIIIRNPLKALRAEFNRKRKGHIGVINETLYTTKDWHKYNEKELNAWSNFHTYWTSNFTESKLILFYEELRMDLVSCLKQMCDFFHMTDICTESRFSCVKDNAEGNFHRSQVKSTFDFYSKDIIEESHKRVLNLYKQIEDCVGAGKCIRKSNEFPDELLDMP